MTQASGGPRKPPRSRYARVAVVGLVVVLTVLGWLLVDGTGSDDGGGSAPAVSTTTTTTPTTTPSPTTTTTPTTTPSPTTTSTTTGARSSSPSRTDRPTSTATDAETGLAWVEPAALPAEARTTIARIEAGGPFPFAKDGAVFGNREQLLPRRARGYYREYTVVTPGSDDRGARRIVTGDLDRQLFWTDDHYASFRRVRR